MEYLKKIDDYQIFEFPYAASIENYGVTASGQFKCISKIDNWICYDLNGATYEPIDGIVTIPSGVTWAAIEKRPPIGYHPFILIEASAPDLNYYPAYEEIKIDDGVILTRTEGTQIFPSGSATTDEEYINYINTSGSTFRDGIAIFEYTANSWLYYIYDNKLEMYEIKSGKSFYLPEGTKYAIFISGDDKSTVKFYHKRHAIDDTYVTLYNNGTELLYHNGNAIIDIYPRYKNACSKYYFVDTNNKQLNIYSKDNIPYYVDCPNNCTIIVRRKGEDANVFFEPYSERYLDATTTPFIINNIPK